LEAPAPSVGPVLVVDEGYDVGSAPDAGAALRILNSWRPSVILLDLMMPVLDGWSLRAHQHARKDIADVR
jgi:CheY-like chemotaxis protein